MGRLTKCLICYSTLRSGNKILSLEQDSNCFGSSGLLANEVSIIFIVRRLLNVPNSVCSRFLQDLGSPTEWFLTACVSCQDLINDAKELANTIHNLEEKLQGLKSKIKIQIEESYRDSGEPPRQNYHKHLKALSEIRYCVAKGYENQDRDWSPGQDEEELHDQQDCTNEEDNNFSDEDVFLDSLGTDDLPHYDCDVPELENNEENNRRIPVPRQVKQRRIKNKPKVFKNFKCSKCKSRFATEDLRHSHFQRKHKGVAFPYQCTICPKAFIYKSNLETHMKIISHQYPERVKEKPEHICSVVGCGKKFSVRYHLKGHIRTVHENRKDFVCEICSNAYTSSRSLKAHQVMIHAGVVDIPSHLCTFCGKSFYALGRFERHVNTKHKNIYPYYCSHCQKGFKGKKEMEDHERMHTGEKPFICEICGRAFAILHALSGHIMRIHSGEKPFHCDTCGQDFADRTWFKRHQELHTGIINNCHICGKGFPIKHNLKIHMKSHANPNGTNNRKLKAKSNPIKHVEKKKRGRKKQEAEIEVEDSVEVCNMKLPESTTIVR